MERTTTDNDDIFRGTGKGPIELVRKGMRVIDAAGEEIGTVDFIKMGDPEARTVEADQGRDGGFIQDIAAAFGHDSEPDVPPTFRARLLRFGFIKVDGSNLTDGDLYVLADKTAGVSGDTVRLTLQRDQLMSEA